jgi:MFS family permease
VEWIKGALGSPLAGDAMQKGTTWTYIVAGIASLVLAGFSLTLPHTPPKPAQSGDDTLAWVKAVKLLSLPFVLVLWVVTFIDAAVHNCYFNWTGRFLGVVGIPGNLIMPVMSIGQVAEILTMFILGSALKAMGWRTTMVVGILGHAARFAVFAFFPDQPWLIVVINVLHGICYAFFFATVYIFVDEFFPKDVRSSAQGLFNFMILGVGQLVANFVCPVMIDQTFKHGDKVDFRGLFLVPCAAALLGAVALAIFFRPPTKKEPMVSGATAPAH